MAVVVGQNLRVFSVDARLTPACLQNGDFKGSHHFIINRNLHNLPNQLRGTLILVSCKVGVVIKAVNCHAIVLNLLPQKYRGTYSLVNLAEMKGYYLQQVGGTNLLGDPREECKPLLDVQGFIKMSNDGPTVVPTIDLFQLKPCPMELQVRLTEISIDLVDRNPSIMRKRKRQTKMVPVLHVLDMGALRRNVTTNSTYRLPIGGIYGVTER